MILTFTLMLAAAPQGQCEPPVAAALDRLKITIQRLEETIDDVDGRSLRKRIRRQVRDARSALQHVRSEVCHPKREAEKDTYVAPVPPPPPEPALSPPMDAASFRALQAAMRAESFPDGKIDVLESAISGQCVTVGQAKGVISWLSFSDAKIRAARLLVPRLSDRNNSFQLIEAFRFPSDKKTLKGILKQAQPVESCWAG